MNYNGEYSLSDIAAVTKGSNNDKVIIKLPFKKFYSICITYTLIS